jgi:ABC-2 type transport system ATP-binding protein
MDKQQSAVELNAIGKVFRNHTIFEDINLAIPQGNITGISGPNGAGKSMLLRIICGLVQPSSGEVRVFGQRIGRDADFPARTGALIDAPGFVPNWSAEKNLRMLADINGKADAQRITEVLSIVGLAENSRQLVGTFSVGMQKRLGIAQAILDKPDLLLLDEPTDSIDQDGWKGIYEYLIALKESGTAILLTSNKFDEINILCDQAYVLKDKQLTPVPIQ